MVLGDPGSGKSTLLRFLALVGQTPSLRRRFKASSDSRLPIIVTLRRYADELKSRPGLPLVDFIVETIHADFSLKAADSMFFDFYLETGKAILCFDGLDELPNPQFKNTVRDRITGFLSTYPGNTCIVTSRLVGYENTVRFDTKGFRHHKIAHLRLPHIEQFISDWYAVREGARKDREDNIRDLTSIINNPEHDAIRELARNPLLLTIITLVHRIDAVLPDERVVLYQKCTETLLNTWHTWKFRDTEDFARRKNTDRRNRRRMEVIAYWMQQRSVGEERKQRAVVGHDELAEFLANHITEQERQSDPERDPEDVAEAFLQFVTERAGLLIEVGDRKYSFVHLTFQEYLTSSNLKTISEKGGVEALWKNIEERISMDRWQEVIRLLVASLLAGDTRAAIIDKLIMEYKEKKATTLISLLLGCLLDSVEEAEVRGHEILRLAVDGSSLLKKRHSLKQIISRLRLLQSKDAAHANTLVNLASSLSGKNLVQTASALTLIASGVPALSLPIERGSKTMARSYRWISTMFSGPKPDCDSQIRSDFQSLPLFLAVLLRISPSANFMAAATHALLPPPVQVISYKLLLSALLSEAHGPFADFGRHMINIYKPFIVRWAGKEGGKINKIVSSERGLYFNHVNSLVRGTLARESQELDPAAEFVRSTHLSTMQQRIVGDLTRHRGEIINANFDIDMPANPEGWSQILHTQEVRDGLAMILASSLPLAPTPHWLEALQSNIPSMVMNHIDYIHQVRGHVSVRRLQAPEVALLLLLEVWLGTDKRLPTGLSCFERLLKTAQSMDQAEVRLALAIRDLVYAPDADNVNIKRLFKNNDGVRQLIVDSYWLPIKLWGRP